MELTSMLISQLVDYEKCFWYGNTDNRSKDWMQNEPRDWFALMISKFAKGESEGRGLYKCICGHERASEWARARARERKRVLNNKSWLLSIHRSIDRSICFTSKDLHEGESFVSWMDDTLSDCDTDPHTKHYKKHLLNYKVRVYFLSLRSIAGPESGPT